MPFTPFHLGPGLLIGLVLYRYVNLPVAVLASIAVDVRAAMVFFGLIDGAMHGPLHTLIGATGVGLAIGAVGYYAYPYTNRLMEKLRLGQDKTWSSMLLGGFCGAVIGHVLLDAVMYPDVALLAPFGQNPLYGLIAGTDVYFIAAGAAFAAGPILTWRIMRN